MRRIKLFEQFISEEDIPKLSRKNIFIPRRLKERWDDLLIPYLNKGYTKEQIVVAKSLRDEVIINDNNVKDFKDIKIIVGLVYINGDMNKWDIDIDEVLGDFNCSSNNLTNRKGSPKIVNGRFISTFNALTSLEGAPKLVTDDVIISQNRGKKFLQKEIKHAIDTKAGIINY